MKKLLSVALAMTFSLGLFAEGEQLWSLVRPEGGFHYISIDQNLDAFSFDVLKYENASLNGHAGYFVYTDEMSGQELENYIKENGVNIAKNQTTVDVGALNEGDKVGFYKWDTTTVGCGWNQTQRTTIDTGYIIGTKVVSRSTDMWGHTTETILDEGTFVDYISGDTYQSGNGGWMKIEISASASAGGGGGSEPASGAPLPGALAVMLVGGIGSLCAKKKRN
ncbi:MAG: hypothetical protein IJL17_21405 [Kiritimatiellae bacterium]|nr:hypothetical protein [Kiritimatiellia bacterium]